MHTHAPEPGSPPPAGEVPQRGCLRDPDVPRECPQGVADAIAACMQVGTSLNIGAASVFYFLIQ